MMYPFVAWTYNKVCSQLSQKLEQDSKMLAAYRRFCFRYLRPKSFNQIPVFINNRNHLTYLKGLIGWLKANNFCNYYVIDNDSTYPPLLDYYQYTLRGRVIFLRENSGHMAFWQKGLLTKAKSSFYVYTDADVMPVRESVPNFIDQLYCALEANNFAVKAGCAISIEDLPEHYAFKASVLNHERKFWETPLQENIYRSPVDTTFALYLPNFYSSKLLWDQSVRVAGDCLVRHQPWYQNSANLTQEQLFYKQQATTKTHWTNFETTR